MCQERMHHGFTMQLLPHKFSHSNQHSSCCLLFRICWVERSIVSMHVPGGYTMGLPLWIAHVVSHWLINCTTHSTAMSANPSHSYADAQKNKSFHSSEWYLGWNSLFWNYQWCKYNKYSTSSWHIHHIFISPISMYFSPTEKHTLEQNGMYFSSDWLGEWMVFGKLLTLCSFLVLFTHKKLPELCITFLVGGFKRLIQVRYTWFEIYVHLWINGVDKTMSPHLTRQPTR